MTAQIVEIAGRQMAILPIEDYQRLIEIVEDKADEAAADKSKQRRMEGEEYLPATMVDRILEGENPLKVWREYRGVSGIELARLANVHASTISKLEKGQRQGTRAVWRALADALRVESQDIQPDD